MDENLDYLVHKYQQFAILRFAVLRLHILRWVALNLEIQTQHNLWMSSEPQVYEAQILQQLIKNAEWIAVVEEKLTLIEGKISDMKTELKTEIS